MLGYYGTVSVQLQSQSDALANQSTLISNQTTALNSVANMMATQTNNPNVFLSVATSSAGDTTIWTPTTGKSFVLMGYSIEITNNVSLGAGGVVTAQLKDGTSLIGFAKSIYAPLIAVLQAGSFDTGWRHIKSGYVSSAVNNSLKVNLSAALVTGVCRVTIIGLEL